jgi:hypothetical protein
VSSASTSINASGTIIGDFTAVKNGSIVSGWMLSGGAFSVLQFPDSSFTRPVSINDAGDVVGYYSDKKSSKNHGFLLTGGRWTTIDVPDSDQTIVSGIDASGALLGSFCDYGKSCYENDSGAGTFIKGSTHGFLLSGGVFTVIDVPGALRTELYQRNRSGQILGRYYDGVFHLFVLDGDTYTTIDVPGAVETAPGWYSIGLGFTDAGEIAGLYCSYEPCNFAKYSFAPGQVHGFLYSGGEFTTLDDGDSLVTGAFGMTATREVAGVFVNADGEQAFIWTPNP